MDLYDLKTEFDKSGIMMCFNGPFSHSIIEETGKAMRNHLEAEHIAQVAVLDVFAVYIELAQNVRNYLTVRKITPPEAMSSIIAIAKAGDQYAVSSGNVVLKNDTQVFCSRIAEVNALTPEELKKQYRQQLRKEVPIGSLGAGLGLLEIAKRATDKIACSIRDIDPIYDFFTLTVLI